MVGRQASKARSISKSLGLAVLIACATVVSGQERASQRPKRQFPSLATGSTLAEDRTLETRVSWARSVDEAANEAEREGKLVFVIHVSGDFEQPEFT